MLRQLFFLVGYSITKPNPGKYSVQRTCLLLVLLVHCPMICEPHHWVCRPFQKVSPDFKSCQGGEYLPSRNIPERPKGPWFTIFEFRKLLSWPLSLVILRWSNTSTSRSNPKDSKSGQPSSTIWSWNTGLFEQGWCWQTLKRAHHTNASKEIVYCWKRPPGSCSSQQVLYQLLLDDLKTRPTPFFPAY